MGVSILVFVELALDATLVALELRLKLFVSILVFVELALDVLYSSVTMLSQERFNPCFRGTCS